MRNKLLMSFIIFLGLLFTVSAAVTFNYAANRNIVYVEGYTCHNIPTLRSECDRTKVVDRTPWGYNPSEPATSNGVFSVPFMNWNSLQTQAGDPGYTYQFALFYSSGYLPKRTLIYEPLPCSNCVNPNTINLNFVKATNCKSEIGNIVYENNIYNDQPLIVSIPASLEADTSAAFGCEGCDVLFTPTDYIDEYYSVHTDINLTITDSVGTEVENQGVHKNIYWDSTETVQFQNWLPPYEDTYTIRVETQVTDDQCSSTEIDEAQNTVTVWPYFPKDECWTEIRSLQVVDPAVPKTTGQPVKVSFEKRSQYAPNYDPWEIGYDAEKSKVNTDITLKLVEVSSGDILYEETVNYPDSGAWGDWELEEFEFIPTESRQEIKIEISGAANDAVCNGKTNTPASAEIDIDIKECVVPDSKVCYNGVANTIDVGECKEGTQTCENGYWSSCDGEVLPTIETCNGKDDDCDGEPDEICGCVEGTTAPCSDFFDGNCGIGTATCLNEQWTGCPQPETEICKDGEDNDCNDRVDCDDAYCLSIIDELTGINPCSCDETNNGVEICDNIDNDCNGQKDDIAEDNILMCKDIDNAYPNIGVCENYKAVCDRGTWRCFISDIPDYETQETSCDNLDNNCDGVADSFTINAKEKGECSINTVSCTAGVWSANNEYIQVEEICLNDKDDDCDGTVDEGCTCELDAERSCYTGPSNTEDKGVCRAGLQECSSNLVWGNCQNQILPSTEICDGKDNDCDGDTDEEGDCCSPNGKTKICVNDPDCPNTQGSAVCENNQWSECEAQCTIAEGVEITSPKDQQRYYTCDEYKSVQVNFKSNVGCQYRLNTMKTYIPIQSGQTVNLGKDTNSLTLKCGQISKTVSFLVLPADDCNEITITDDKELFKQEGLSQDLIDDAQDLDQSLEYSYIGDETHITNEVDTGEGAQDFKYALYIPKCLTEYLDAIEFENDDYEIIKEDPVIMWHFTEVKGRVDLGYKVRGRIPKDCLEQIKGLPIAELLNLNEDDQGTNWLAIIFSMVVIGIAVSFVLINHGYHQTQSHSKSVSQSMEASIVHTWNMYLQEIKHNKLDKQQAIDYMNERGLSDNCKKWILAKL